MGDSESGAAASKKRVAGRQISKENPEIDDDGPEPEMGTFRKASDEVLATRRIVKVKRTQTPAATSSNPFASLRMVPPSNLSGDTTEVKSDADGKGTESGTSVDEPNGTEDSNKKVEEKIDTPTAKDVDKVEGKAVEEATPAEAEKAIENGEKGADEKVSGETAKEETVREKVDEEKSDEDTGGNDNKDAVDAAKPVSSFSSFQQLSSSQNAFTGLTGTGFGTSSFSFGSIIKEGPNFGASSGTAFGFKSDNNGGTKNMQEVPIETGEENEEAVFTADAVLYEYLDGGWKERGKGELKLNVSLSGVEKARLIMRARGNYRLILNASIYPDMSLTNMEKKGITFACINSAGEGKNGLTTFAAKFKDGSFVEEFRGAVEAHKGTKGALLKTPENSPKASGD